MNAIPLFADLDEPTLARLMQGGKTRHFAKGVHIFRFGDAISHFYIVKDGAVQLFRETPDGHEMTAEVALAGDTIGETEILQRDGSYRFNAVAIKDTELLEFPVSWLQESIKKSDVLALNVLGILSQRVHIATVESEHKATMTAAQQVACFLKRLCILHNFDPRGFELPYSKTLIASRLGMELETLSRALSKVREHGISIRGSHVAFDNIDKVGNFVCADCSMTGHCTEDDILRERLL